MSRPRKDNTSMSLHETINPVDELHREMGERLSAGVLGMLDFLSGLRNNHSQLDTAGLATAIRQVIVEETRPLYHELSELRSAIDEIKTALHKLSMLNAAALHPGSNDFTSPAPVVSQPIVKQELGSERISRTHVIERMLTTTRKLQESGRDISQMTAAALAREAGVKPAQFTYAFKNREKFMQHYVQWLSQQQSA